MLLDNSYGKKIDYSSQEIELADALQKLTEKYDVYFTYDKSLVRDVTVNYSDQGNTVEEDLNYLLKGTELQFKIFEDRFVIIYRLDKEGMSSLRSMVEHFSDILEKDDNRSNFKPTKSIPIREAWKPKQRELTGLALSVSGTVKDQQGEVLIGVNVLVKGTTNGTSTDFDGRYTLENVNENATLVFSYIGYQTIEIPVDGRREVEVTMISDSELLEEVVVVGYGTVKKSDLTGSVSSVKDSELNLFPTTSAIHALQGKTAGVMVQSTNGEPGGSFKIRVRGSTSINASSNPLFVVDGFVGGVLPPTEDIASMEILKDASATAIYGSRGANGVVMVTTKSGAEGRARFNYNTYYSAQREIDRLELLGAQDFAEYINEARNSDFYDLDNIQTNTDWQDLIFRPGYAQNHQLSMSGGSEKVKYYVSGVYFDQKGVINNSDYDRLSLLTNISFQATNRINIKLNSTIRGTNKDGIPTQTGGIANNSGVVSAAQRFDPNQGILDEDGTYTKSRVGIAAFENPMAILDGRTEENVQDEFQTNLQATVDVFENLTFNSSYGLKVVNSRNGVYNSRITNLGEGNLGQGNLGYTKNKNFITEQYFLFTPDLGSHSRLSLTTGFSFQQFNSESLNASNTGFLSDALGFWNLAAGVNLLPPSSNYTESAIVSGYGRANYSILDKYIFTFTGRYDGASQFSEGNKWSFFPSGAFSWNISKEGFFPQNKLLTNLRLRTSYGLTGNQAISSYQSLSKLSTTYFVYNNGSVSSVRPTAIANKDLTWETTEQVNFGLDGELFEGRLNFVMEYYYKKTRDLLFNVPIPIFSGYQNRLENIGALENKGFEFQLGYKIFTEGFKWDATFNISQNKNKVLKLPSGNDIIFTAAPSAPASVPNSILREGYPVGSFYGFVFEGLYQEGDDFIPGGGFETSPGGEKFADLNNDGVLNSDDRKIIGDPNPDFVWGLNNEMSYKGFSLNLFFQAYVGGDMLNIVRMELDRLSGNSNATIRALDRWTPSNTDTDVPKATSDRAARTSTRFVEDGTYIRLKNISFGYNLPKNALEKLKLNSARIYLSGQNVITFTDYSGVDPEVAFRSSNTNLGLDFGSYPNIKSLTIGLNLGF
ncbi:TonB-dependent receptor [Membranihabitans marinus]